ncbi:MAG: FkbM family methyltransferase [Lysobacterales bacterium]
MIFRQWSALRRLRQIRHRYYSDYLQKPFLRHLDRSAIDVVFEIGAWDGSDALALRDYFEADVTTFECNPDSLQACRRRLRGQHSVRLVETAVWDQSGPIQFFPVTRSTTPAGEPTTDHLGSDWVNSGASSCFRARDDYLQRYEQDEILVPALRLDDYCRENGIDAIDLLCVDVQGAALQVLRSLGKYTRQVRNLIIELEHRPLYHGQSLFPECDDFLVRNGFKQTSRVWRDDWFSDYLYTGS